jgi:nucleotide-binding universal stress UspA family protein
MEEYFEDGLKMESSILCITDFSQSSNRALRWAIDIAEKNEGHITLLHAFRLLQSNGKALQMKQKQEELALAAFSNLELSHLKGHTISYDFKTEVGFVIDRIEDHTRNNPIDLVVLSKNISEENKEIFDELIERTKIPLAIIP